MRFIGRVLGVLVALVLVLAVVGFLLPRHVPVERSVLIEAPPDAVFPWVNSLQKTAEWSPWMGLDPALKVTYEGPEAGVGNVMSWTSDLPEVGSGRQEITLSEPNRRVESALDFGGMGTARASFDLVPEGSGTRLTWGLTADMGNNPIGRYMGLMIDRWVGADYDSGLSRLKRMVEGS
jgi:carbon monoxide dehydrogenase subunit G